MQNKTSRQDRFLLPAKTKILQHSTPVATNEPGMQKTRRPQGEVAMGRRPGSEQPGVFSADGDEEEPTRERICWYPGSGCACKRRTERNLRSSRDG